MPTPVHSQPIGVTVYGVDRHLLDGATVTLTIGSYSTSGTTNSKGECILNLGDLTSWDVGDTATIVASKTNKGTLSSTITITNSPQTLTMVLAETSDVAFYTDEDSQNRYVIRGAIPLDFEGNKITTVNPLPVKIVNAGDYFDLVNNPSTTWTITRSDGQPNSETITVRGVSYKRSFTYNTSGLMTRRTEWVKQ